MSATLEALSCQDGTPPGTAEYFSLIAEAAANQPTPEDLPGFLLAAQFPEALLEFLVANGSSFNVPTGLGFNASTETQLSFNSKNILGPSEEEPQLYGRLNIQQAKLVFRASPAKGTDGKNLDWYKDLSLVIHPSSDGTLLNLESSIDWEEEVTQIGPNRQRRQKTVPYTKLYMSKPEWIMPRENNDPQNFMEAVELLSRNLASLQQRIDMGTTI